MKLTFKSVYEMKEFARDLLAEEHQSATSALYTERNEALDKCRDLEIDKENVESQLSHSQDRIDSLRNEVNSVRVEYDRLCSENRKLRQEMESFRATKFNTYLLGKGLCNFSDNAVQICQEHPEEVRQALRFAFGADQRIDQIKFIREATYCGLKEGKDFIEDLPLVIR